MNRFFLKDKQHKAIQKITEPRWVRWFFILIALFYIGLFLILPLISVFYQALHKGLAVYLAAIRDPDALSAIHLTLLTLILVVPFNLIFGLAAAWAIGNFEFKGKNLLITLIDLPFTVSPVTAGLIYILVYGIHGWLGPWLEAYHLKVIFAVPGIILTTIFVTFPLIARELIPLMQSNGTEEEEAAIVLGASGWQTFFKVTLVNIKWGLIYGIILCSARAIGEFGAASVVSGHIRGETTTIPLQVEILYNEYNYVAAFALASILALLAIVTLVVKFLMERKAPRRLG